MEERFCLMPSFNARAFPKCEVNCRSQLLIILVGSLNYLYKCFRYNCMMPTLVIVMVQGMNVAALEHPWSTIVRMASFS
jgi:hypothetical protein